jgi:hypothetical protein
MEMDRSVSPEKDTLSNLEVRKWGGNKILVDRSKPVFHKQRTEESQWESAHFNGGIF